MDPNLIRHIEYFSVPNNQTVNPVDRAAQLSRTNPAQHQSLWNPSALGSDGGASLSPSTPQSAGSFDPFQPSNTPITNISFSPPQRQRSTFAQGPRTILPTRTPKPPRDRHERKRSKLSTDATPFDSVDYWLQFDNEEGGIQEEPGSVSFKSEPQSMGRPGTMQTDRSRDRRQTAPQVPAHASTQAQAPIRAQAQAQAQSDPSRLEESIDDSALDNALSDNEDYSSINLAEQLSKIDSVAPSDVPQREGLYSTPLSWERPQPGLRMDSIMSIQTPATLDQAEQRRLIAIAMNPGSSMGGLGSSIVNQYTPNPGLGSVMGSSLGGPMGPGGLGTTTMSQVMNVPPHGAVRPTPMHPPHPPQRQGSYSDAGKEKHGQPHGQQHGGKGGDRTAHNDIERKYRTNLKDKIAELRDAVPALRTIPENAVDDGEDGGQPSRGPKVSKGTVLTKATEYIHYLEKKNKMIVQQHQELSRRLQAFEQLLNATARPTYQMPNYSRTLFDPRAFC